MPHYSSIGHQCCRAFQATAELGESRHRAKRKTRAQGQIFSIRTLQDYIKIGFGFARFVKEHYPKVRLARQFRPEMVLDYMYWCRDVEGNAPGTLGRKAAALRKLDIGLRRLGWCPANALPLLSHDDWSGTHSPARPEKSYTLVEAMIIEQEVWKRDKQSGQVVRLMWRAGLRVREAVNLMAESIYPEEGKLVLTKRDKTKGGRPRTVVVDSSQRKFLAALKRQGDANPTGRVFRGLGSLRTRVYVAVRDTCRREDIEMKGLHAFRKTFAQVLLAKELVDGEAEEDAMMTVSEALGHGRLEVLKHYVPGQRQG